jgi:hypothetical protein
MAGEKRFAPYSSESNFPKVGLCLESFRDSLSVGILCTGGGMPMASRAIDFTALVALNLFFFLRGAMKPTTRVDASGIMQ